MTEASRFSLRIEMLVKTTKKHMTRISSPTRMLMPAVTTVGVAARAVSQPACLLCTRLSTPTTANVAIRELVMVAAKRMAQVTGPTRSGIGGRAVSTTHAIEVAVAVFATLNDSFAGDSRRRS